VPPSSFTAADSPTKLISMVQKKSTMTFIN
jgi:hypothetical protein